MLSSSWNVVSHTLDCLRLFHAVVEVEDIILSDFSSWTNYLSCRQQGDCILHLSRYVMMSFLKCFHIELTCVIVKQGSQVSQSQSTPGKLPSMGKTPCKSQLSHVWSHRLEKVGINTWLFSSLYWPTLMSCFSMQLLEHCLFENPFKNTGCHLFELEGPWTTWFGQTSKKDW